MRELNSVIEIERSTDLTFFVEPLTALFGDAINQIKVVDFFKVEEGELLTYSVVLAVKESILIQVPGLNALRFGVVRDSTDEWPLIYCEVTLSQNSAASLTVQHFPLRIEIDNPYLKPVQVHEELEVLPGFSFEIEGGFSIDTDMQVSATLEAFSLPPFEIVGAGLVLALDECRLIMKDEDVDEAITDLGFSQGFRGMHAKSALLHWDLPVQFQGNELPGLRASFEDIALGNQGVSVSAQLNWPVVYQNGEFDVVQTEVLGFFIDPQWSFALASLNVGVQANIPNAMSAAGHVRIPFLDAIFDLAFFTAYAGEDKYELQASLSLGVDESVEIPLGSDDYRIEIQALSISGRLEQDDSFDFEGNTSCVVELPGITVGFDTAIFTFKHRQDGDLYRLQLSEVEIDNIGSVGESELNVVTQLEQDGTTSLKSFELTTIVIWSDISDRILLSQVPDAFPLPPDDAELTLHVSWVNDQIQLNLKVELEEVDQLWRFIPEAQRPQVAEAKINIDLIVNGNDFDGELGLSLRFRLPEIDQLPGLADIGISDLLHIETGDAEGWLEAEFKAELSSDSGELTGSLNATLNNPVSLAFNLPGLLLPAAPLEVTITDISIEVSEDEGQMEGEFKLGGSFVLRPILPADLGSMVPFPMAVHLERLLATAHLYDLAGTVALRLGIASTGGYCALDCSFTNSGLEIDLFDMLAGVVNQIPGVTGDQGTEIDLDIDVTFILKNLTLSIGQLPDTQDSARAGIPFSFGLMAELGFAGLFTDIAFNLNNESLSFGIETLSIPIALPQLPLNRSDLDAIRDTNGQWDANIWTGIEETIDTRLSIDSAILAQARNDLEQIEANQLDDQEGYAQQVYDLRYRTIPAIQKRVFQDTGNKFLTGAIMTIHQLLGTLSTTDSQASYQGMVELYQDAVDATVGALHFDTGMQFVISDAKFVLPFNDPSNIRVEGGASLKGFEPDHPLKPMEDLVFKLGLSSDALYFAVEGGADPIPLPDFGRYPGNAIVFDRLIIGYGYSKNSLLIDFAAELQLSPALIEDADTSSRLGVGVRLPSNSALKFKIDLIPIVLGEVDFLLPLIAFDINLRSKNPPMPPVSDNCAPAWDGLQFIAPGIMRADLKRTKFSPFFGPLPAPNYLTAFDIDVGNAHIGLTHICDNYQVITPVMGNIPIPFLADSTPFFDLLCTNLRLAGFGINFDLRRPFPHPNPLMIFELMGFLSAPTLPIDPAGHLGNLMWAELSNARITLPPAVLGMFPSQGRSISQDLNVRINVGTIITLAQQLNDIVDELLDRMAQTGGDVADLVEHLTQSPPEILIGELLDALPQDMRRLELDGSFVGFDASAIFLLVSPNELRASLLPPPVSIPPVDTSPPEQNLLWVNVINDTFRRNPLSGWKEVNYGLKKGLKGNWRISRGALLQMNNVGDNSSGRYGAMLIREIDPLNDLRISVDLKCADDDGIGVLFHVQGKDSFYRFRMTSAQKDWRLMRLKQGKSRILFNSETSFKPGKSYNVRIEARSVPQSSVVLPGSFDIRRAGQPISVHRTRVSKKQRFTTHIKIWVNNSLWCDIADTDLPLTEGQVGLDSWWSIGAQFDNFCVDWAQRTPLSFTYKATRSLAQNIVPLMSSQSSALPKTTDTVAWIADDFAGFSDHDLLMAIPETDSPAVVVAARVNLLANQLYRFVGVMQADGYFHLLTSINVDPLTLKIAGIDISFPLDINGRIMLEGYSAGADSWSRFEAELYGEWDMLPTTAGSLAKLIVGNELHPATIIADSRQSFKLQGSGELQLFANQLNISGSLDISDKHAFINGSFIFKPALNVTSSIPVLELNLDVQGRIGPERNFLLSGNGDLKLLGKTFSTVAAELSPDGIMLEAQLNPDSEDWVIKGFALSDFEMALRGRVGFRATVPDIQLEGAGKFKIADVLLEGQCQISANQDGWCLGASGKVHWQGRDWLQGAIELCNDRLHVQGQTEFMLNLIPNQLPANIQIAGLVLKAKISGAFSVRSSGRLSSCNFKLDWTLAIQLPGSQANQSLPIVSQHLNVNIPAISGNRSNVVLKDLIDIDGLTLFELDGISIPIPTVSSTESTTFYVNKGIPVDPPSLSLPFEILSLSSTGPSGQTNTPSSVAFLYWERPKPSINIPAFNLPIPFLSNQPPEDDSNLLTTFSLPTIVEGVAPLSGGLRLDNLKLGLQLRWKDGKLGIWVTQKQEFIAFDSLPLAPLGIAITI